MIKSFAKELDYDIPKGLQPFVVSVIQGESEGPVHITYPVFAIGYPLIINVYRDLPKLHVNNSTSLPKSRLNLAGQVCNAEINIEVHGSFGQIGFMLHPLAPYYLFHRPGRFFLNRWRSYEEASPLGTKKLMGNLSSCKKPVDRLAILLEYLDCLAYNRLPPIDWLDASLEEIFKKDGTITQTELSEKIGVGPRHFRRKFKEIIGVSPKYYCKVIQLNTIFELIKSTDSRRLLHLALDCGYYDQAHFIKDFNKLIGSSPENFLQGGHAFVKTYMGRRAT